MHSGDPSRDRTLEAIERAGFEPWPKLVQNLRASAAIDLVDRFPEHVVAKWVGHSVAVAAKHYLRPTDTHWQKAV